MLEKHHIEVKERGKNITFINNLSNKRVRGSRLGNRYEKEELINGFEKQITSRQDQERGNTTIPNITNDQSSRSIGIDDQIEGNRGLSVDIPEREHEQRDSNNKRTGKDQRNESTNSRTDEIDFSRIDQQLAERKRSLHEAHRQKHAHSSEYDTKSKSGIREEQNFDREGITRYQREQSKGPKRIERDEPELS